MRPDVPVGLMTGWLLVSGAWAAPPDCYSTKSLDLLKGDFAADKHVDTDGVHIVGVGHIVPPVPYPSQEYSCFANLSFRPDYHRNSEYPLNPSAMPEWWKPGMPVLVQVQFGYDPTGDSGDGEVDYVIDRWLPGRNG